MSESQFKLEPILVCAAASSAVAAKSSIERSKLDADLAAQDKSVRRLRERHWTMLWVAGIIIVATFTLRRGDGEVVYVPFTGIQLPTLCGSRALFNVECPGCGLTRSFLALGIGDFRNSFQLHRLGWLMAFAVIAQIPYRIYCLWEIKHKVVVRTWPTLFGNFLIIALIVNWLMKMNSW